MRHKSFMCRNLATNETTEMHFGREHYTTAGVPFAPVAGMPVLEAHQLVNHWNQTQANFVYWL